LRNKLFAGVLAAVPLGIIIYAAILAEEKTEPLTKPLGFHFPGLGVLLIVIAVYVLGLFVTSIFGRFFLALLDRVIRRVPGLKFLYQAWKDVLVHPAGRADIYSKVVLVPVHGTNVHQIGFTSGEPMAGNPKALTVFLPNAPNPITGQLVIVECTLCRPLNISLEDAFKFLLSTGNYEPCNMEKTALEGDPNVTLVDG
jgi:uncharacterized membrane protein